MGCFLTLKRDSYYNRVLASVSFPALVSVKYIGHLSTLETMTKIYFYVGPTREVAIKKKKKIPYLELFCICFCKSTLGILPTLLFMYKKKTAKPAMKTKTGLSDTAPPRPPSLQLRLSRQALLLQGVGGFLFYQRTETVVVLVPILCWSAAQKGCR